MKTFFTFLLYVLIILLIGGIVFGVSILLGRPLMEAAVIFGLILALWLLIVLVKKAIVLYRARRQVKRVLQQEDAIVDPELGQSTRQLLKSLKKDWKKAIKTLRRSHLKLKGDPLYVLPWYMIFGKPRSGKSTALRNAKLLSPAMELSKHEDGSTLNLEWWLYDQAIVIDTAGRYAVPDNDKRDRKEWNLLLSMLARHKQKEPLNGVVIVVSAERLLHCSEEELQEEGQQVREGINELMEKLEIQMPVYLMVTKCDLIDQFENWCAYLPEESLDQVMGYLSEDDLLNADALIDKGLDSVINRIKELRLLMMERSDNPDDSLIELPVNLEKLRSGLHAYARTALKDNLYQETPRFRGLYFSSSQQAVNDPQAEGGGRLRNRGLFLHDLFTRVMPPDRGILSTLPSAERLRRAVRNYGFSISSVILIGLIVALTTAFYNDKALLDKIIESNESIDLQQSDINEQVFALYRLGELIDEVGETEAQWLLPWYGPFNHSPQYRKLVATYVDVFDKQLLDIVDRQLAQLGGGLESRRMAWLVSGLVRRINLIKARLAEDDETFAQLPPVPDEYLQAVSQSLYKESSKLFNPMYRRYLRLQPADVALIEEQNKLQSLLHKTVTASHGSYEWLLNWTNMQGFAAIKLDDFWSGSRLLTRQPEIKPAFTLQGRDFILAFLDELNRSSEGSVELARVKSEFLAFYDRKYLKAWHAFAEKFDLGKNKLRGRREWQDALESMTGKDNPYFALIRTITREIEPVYAEGFFSERDKMEYFAEIQDFSGDKSGAVDNSKAKKKAAKEALKIIGKFGKVGKTIAKVGKKGLKAQKKINKIKGKKKPQGPDLDKVLEEAAKAYKEYKKAIEDIAFNADSPKLSYNATANAFLNPDAIDKGDDAGAHAWAAIKALQKVVGKPRKSSKLFWDLYSGPVRLAYDYMREEAACYLQTGWEDNVLAAMAGISEDKLGPALIGENGLVWDYVDNDAKPFLKKRYRKGYVPNVVKGNAMPWEKDFLQFINHADEGRNLVANEYTVKISALPTGINQGASIAPYATYLDLHCADDVQTLANYNYSASKDFVWSLEKCGDVSLRIEVGEYSLVKQYTGRKGFARFLADFRDGRRIFTPKDFPELASQLKNAQVKAIDVNYKIRGQQPVIKTLTAVPLSPPDRAIACWNE